MTSCGKKTEETTPVSRQITETVFASGILEAANTYNLTAQAEGYIEQMNFEEGQLIQKGKTLLRVKNQESPVNVGSATELFEIAIQNTQKSAPLLQQAEANILITKQKHEQETIQANRYRKLWEANSIAKVEYENALLNEKTAKLNYESAVENLKKLNQDARQQVISQQAQKEIYQIVSDRNLVVAMSNGKVYKKLKQIGDFVKRGETVAIIGDANDIYAKINVDESNIAKLKIGQKAVIQLNTQKDKNYQGTLSQIYPQFDDASRSYICKLTFSEPLGFNIVNTPLQSNIVIGQPQTALLIPKNYLDFNNQVQIKGREGKTKVNTKIISNEWVQVVSGIGEKDVLVTDQLTVK
jgi:HlyD family secretion protein